MAKKKQKNSEVELKTIDSKKKGKSIKKTKGEQAEDDDASSRRQLNRTKVTSTTSWTGKLPHTLLHEKCQKLKWNKVEYDMKRIGDKGMIAIAKISYTDSRSKETLTMRMEDPTFDKTSFKGVLKPQETPIEARHLAATVALYRIGYNTNLHMMLPPNHKKVWHELDDFRKQLEKENPKRAKKLFDIDPFKTMLEERKRKEQIMKERESRSKNEEKQNKGPILITSIDQKISRHSSSVNSNSLFSRRAWENATFIDFDEQTRELIEKFLRHHINWKDQEFDVVNGGSREELKNKLLSLGFRNSHVEEAMGYKDPLSFLIYNVPEDDFPEYFRKKHEETMNKIEITSLPLPKRNMIDRLMELGTSYEETKLALEHSDYNEANACVKLLSDIYEICPVERTMSLAESDDLWKQEIESLKSIYQDALEEINPETFSINLVEKFKVKIKIYKTDEYPFMIPGIVVSTFNKKFKLPSYIKIILLRKLLYHIDSLAILGDMLVFHIVDWIECNIAQIIENPGPLLIQKIFNDSRKHVARPLIDNIRKKSPTFKPLTTQELLILKNDYEKRVKCLAFTKMTKQRSALPAWRKQNEIIDLIKENNVVLITGETGSGKSTQVVQFILDNLMNQKDITDTRIICTQPRRISAIGLAERVAEERLVNCGDEVGYVIRGVNLSNRLTRIRFMTTGILVKILQNDPSTLNNSIVVVDEVHERSIDTDLIIILLKNLLMKIPGLKIVLMSATVDTQSFSSFFKGLKSIHIEGRTFPIQEVFLEDTLSALDFKIKKNSIYSGDDELSEDVQFLVPKADSRFFATGRINYELICETVNHIHKELAAIANDGSVVVFLPGVGEVSNCCNLIKKFDAENRFEVLPLHSALSPEDQKRVFRRFIGKRKVVVATNIAETSITIDDCVATIDTGKVKTLNYDPVSNTSKLVEKFESKAEAKQRKGRAGRVRAGFSYKLFSRKTYDEMDEQPQPEMKRVALESLYLSVRSMGVKNVTKFLENGLDPPPLASLKKAEQILTTLGLLSYEEKSLTELGKMVSLMPVMDSKHGKLLIYSIIFGCTDIGVLIASILSVGGSPFVNEFDNRNKIRSILSDSEKLGDVLAVTRVINKYLSLSGNDRNKFLKNNCLSFNKITEILSSRTQYYSILKDIGFLPFSYKPGSSEYLNRNSNNFKILKCVLTGSFYPNVARVQFPDPKFVATSVGAVEVDPEMKSTKYWIRNEEFANKLYDGDVATDKPPSIASRAFIHPSSLLFSQGNTIPEDAKTLNDNSQTLKKNISLSSSNSPFLVFNGIQHTSKIFLRYITPTSTFAILLFGGNLRYDIDASSHSPGMIVDNWLPIRTWCKNGLILKELRYMVDRVIKEKLENPHYKSTDISSQGDDILQQIEEIIKANT